MRYYNFLTKRLMRSYIFYIVLFAMIMYFVCLFSSIRNYKSKSLIIADATAENIISAIDYSMYMSSVLSDSDIIGNYVYCTDKADINYAALQTFGYLKASCVSSQYALENVALANLSANMVTSSSGSYNLSFFASMYGLDVKQMKDCLTNMTSKKKTYTFMKITNTDHAPYSGRYFIMISSINSGSRPIPIIFVYNADKFLNIPNEFPDSCAMLININSESITVNNPESTVIPGKFSTKEVCISQSTHRICDVQCTFIAKRLYYYACVNSFLIVFWLFLCVIIFIVIYSSRKSITDIYAPVKALMKNLPQINDDSASEFSHIETLFKGLVSEKNALSSSITDYQSLLTNQFLLNVMNRTVSYDEVQKHIYDKELGDIQFPAVVCIMRSKGMGTPVEHIDSDELFAIHSASKCILDETFLNLCNCRLIDYDIHTFILIAPYHNYTDIRNLLITVISQIYSQLGTSITGTVGCPAENLYDLYNSFSVAMDLQRRFIDNSDYTIVLTPEDIPYTNSFPLYSPQEEDLIINLTLSCDRTAVCEIIKEIITRNISDRTIEKDSYIQLTVMLYFTIQKILYTTHRPEHGDFNDNIIYDRIKNCRTPEQLIHEVCDIITVIINHIKNVKTTRKEQSKHEMLEYIHKNYNKAISLTSMSEALNMSQSYISKQFKQLTGENFKDYLTAYRIEQAVQLFRENPVRSIQSVAEAVGYDNTTTFSRAFVKHCGIQPGKFRNRILDKS
ncbi:MAG: helix-turn-helix transcriptional regulator [Clostridia bacterium]|nr:helix-turn-helix transcriptional regulator [Clostridia bacterium]